MVLLTPPYASSGCGFPVLRTTPQEEAKQLALLAIREQIERQTLGAQARAQCCTRCPVILRTPPLHLAFVNYSPHCTHI